jgi:hypothetical protein
MLALLAAVGDTHWHLNPTILYYLSGMAIPLVVGVITKWKASSAVKAWCNFVLSAIAGGLSVALASNGDVTAVTWVVGIIQTFVVSIASYYGLWKHTVAPAIQQATPNFGIGTPVEDPVPANRYNDILPDQSQPPLQVDRDVSEPADAVVTPPQRASGAKKATAKSAGPQGKKKR